LNMIYAPACEGRESSLKLFAEVDGSRC